MPDEVRRHEKFVDCDNASCEIDRHACVFRDVLKCYEQEGESGDVVVDVKYSITPSSEWQDACDSNPDENRICCDSVSHYGHALIMRAHYIFHRYEGLHDDYVRRCTQE